LKTRGFCCIFGLPGRKFCWSWSNGPNGGITKRMGTLVQALKKPKDNGNTYSRAGTAELKPYTRIKKKFRKKFENILIL
jgi:hypothetical protein